DLDYPYAKYDQVFVPEFSAGAMENVGCVTISEMLVFRSKTTDLFYELRANTILHEMAHMWFGDLVTMRWWDDLWLNESFAEFCATLASAEATRFTDAWTTFSGARKVWGYGQDQLPSTHPIAADIDTLTEAVANFDGISYAKGASVLKQLVAFIGRDNFFTGIRAYFAEHAGGNATLADLLRALEKSSGIDLSEWTRAWLQTAGPNSVRSDFTLDDSGAFASFTVVQEAPAAFPTLRPHHLAIGLYALQDGSLVRTHQVEVNVAGARTDVPELVGVAQPDLILLNDDDLSFVLIRFDERSLATLGTSIGHFRDSLARTVCWSAVIDMASQAEMSVPAFVRIVASGMVVEPSVTVLQILHFFSRGLLTSADPAWIGQGRAALADAAVPMLHAAVPGSDAQLIWAQLVGSTAATDDQLDLLAGLLDGSVEIEGLAVDTDLRWTLLSRLAATGRADAAAIDAEAARDATDAGARHAIACRAAMPVAERKAEAWRQLTESEELGYEGVQEVAVAFTDPGQAELLQPYVERYFQALPGLWASRSEVYRMLLCAMIFPHYAASLELIEQVDSFLAAGDRDPALVRLLTEQRDRVTRALKSRTLPVG
ncbi:MAG TPA: aminopeptidase N, partial [Micromonosporaceae bacterium]